VTDTLEPELVIQGGASIEVQLRSQIRKHILNGALLPGEELPSVRSVAVQLAIKPNIVERAYRELERQGILSSEEGSGMFVADSIQGRMDRPAPISALQDFCREWMERAARCGYSVEDIIGELTTSTCGDNHEESR